MVERCSNQWKRIKELEGPSILSEEEEEELTRLHNVFTLTVSADYQMSKLIPFWGMSPQPGSTYCLQKLSNDIFGIVDHSHGESTVYIFDERLGPKHSDHTILYISHYLTTIPSWIKRIHFFLNNAGNTNKNMYVMAWAMKMVQHRKFDVVWISFMIAGHTKFSIDQLFSRVAQSYNSSDVFTIAELGNVAEPYCSMKINTGGIVKQWRSLLTKYTNIPGIRSFHDFVLLVTR